jgi:hypothetical protein
VVKEIGLAYVSNKYQEIYYHTDLIGDNPMFRKLTGQYDRVGIFWENLSRDSTKLTSDTKRKAIMKLWEIKW